MKTKIGLFVVNQDVDFNRLQKMVLLSQLDEFVILSTHHFFFTERHQLQSLLVGKKIKFISFGEFFSEEEMSQYDEEAFQSVDRNESNHWEAPRLFKEVMIYNKNKRIYKELCNNYNIDEIYYWSTLVETYNLGVSNKFWSELEAKRLTPRYSYHTVKRFLFFTKRLGGLEGLGLLLMEMTQRLRCRTFYLVDFQEEKYLFHSLNRMKFKKNTPLPKVSFTPLRFLSFTRSNRRDAMFERFVRHVSDGESVPVRWATPLHEYPSLRLFVKAPAIPLYIFEDAFRSTNYPVHSYSKILYMGKVVVRDMYDFAYFEGSGKDVLKPYGPLAISKFDIEKTEDLENKVPKVVILSINHTGDWTYLINRSDTDLLIENFALLAKDNPQLQFVIRMHPTMARPIAEGINSKTRIIRFAKNSGIPNLSVSKVSLEEDWERGDIFISEYSLSVMDAMRRGKIGFFMNPTARRSFVQDFIDLGFPHTNSYEEMKTTLAAIIERPDYYREAIIESASKYNAMLDNFLNDTQ
jgi:hypothetical protein